PERPPRPGMPPSAHARPCCPHPLNLSHSGTYPLPSGRNEARRCVRCKNIEGTNTRLTCNPVAAGCSVRTDVPPPMPQSGAAPGLPRIPEQGGDVGAADALHLAHAGGRGDVDLGDVVADHVDADEDEAALLEKGTDARADFALAFGELGRL